MASRASVLKEYFSVPSKAVTNGELLSFAKGDKKGYVELSDAAAKVLGVTIDK